MNPFQSLRNYEFFIYTLTQQFLQITRSTLTVVQRGRLFAEVSGQLDFGGGHCLDIYELLSWVDDKLMIEAYSYEAWQNGEKLYWYDSQSHPNDPLLASTDPHHKHVPPNMKHNRVPAPDLTFLSPNLPFLIRELATVMENSLVKK